MAIESFLIDEVENLITDCEDLDKWQALVDEVGLEGQKELQSGDGKSPVPFPPMTTEMIRVYQTLCPNHNSVNRYSGTTIPLRVLSLLALCKQEQYFKTIQVWYAEDKPDPIAVGYIENEWSGVPYLIARWGDELASFPELKALAIKRKIETATNELKQVKIKVSAMIEHIETTTESWMLGKGNDDLARFDLPF